MIHHIRTKVALAILCFVLTISHSSIASETIQDFDLWKLIRNIILPDQLKHFYELREYIASDEFSKKTDTLKSDLRVDEIFFQAVKITEGDVVESLLISSVATLPYHTFDAVVPILRLVITVPVSTESFRQYQKRLHNLPSKIFLDSKTDEDKDKLTHFFGSAYLTCVLRNSGTVEGIGHIVEWMESVFKLEGSRDERDINANIQGIIFATALMEHRNVVPSEFLHVSLNPK